MPNNPVVKMAHLKFFIPTTIILSEDRKDEGQTSTTIILPAVVVLIMIRERIILHKKCPEKKNIKLHSM